MKYLELDLSGKYAQLVSRNETGRIIATTQLPGPKLDTLSAQDRVKYHSQIIPIIIKLQGAKEVTFVSNDDPVAVEVALEFQRRK